MSTLMSSSLKYIWVHGYPRKPICPLAHGSLLSSLAVMGIVGNVAHSLVAAVGLGRSNTPGDPYQPSKLSTTCISTYHKFIVCSCNPKTYLLIHNVDTLCIVQICIYKISWCIANTVYNCVTMSMNHVQQLFGTFWCLQCICLPEVSMLCIDADEGAYFIHDVLYLADWLIDWLHPRKLT